MSNDNYRYYTSFKQFFSVLCLSVENCQIDLVLRKDVWTIFSHPKLTVFEVFDMRKMPTITLKHQPPCRGAVDGLIDGKNSEGLAETIVG